MKKEWKNKGRSLTASLLITVLVMSGAFTSMAESGFVFEDWDISAETSGRGGRKSASGSGLHATDSETEDGETATESSLPVATNSIALFTFGSSSIGDIWDRWAGDFSFLDGSTGDGSKKKPYQIKNKDQLMGLSQLAAMGMRVQEGEGDEDIIGFYDGNYFKLMRNIDLGGMEWRPIGFYQDSSELSGDVSNKFTGHFDGNGKTVSNFKLSDTSWSNTGFFGAVEDAEITDLTLKPGKTVYGKSQAAILAGSAVNSRIYNCTVDGSVSAAGTAGGVVGTAEGNDKADSVIENCTAKVTVNVNGGSELFAGGIAGKAARTSIVDCRVETGNNDSARIQGHEAAVGGITGFQNDTDIYNSFVSGTIGGEGSLIVGGITGKYASGHLKVARFEGTIGQTGSGSAGHRGTFIGHREAGDFFRYGEDVSYLFADTVEKIAANVSGSGIADDNEYTYDHHIGFSHGGDIFYSLVQGGVTKDVTDIRYYEELENGILSIMEEDNGGADAAELGYEIDHMAPNDAGRPTRGYLLTVQQTDTVSNGTNYYDVAVLEAKGSGSYYGTLSKDHRGAIAAGKSVTVTTSPNNTEDAKFQMKGAPTYTKGGREMETTYVKGGEYIFTMPEENTEVKAVYEKVAVRVSVNPQTLNLSVTEERTGNRKNPTKTTKVLNGEGKLIATYINGVLNLGTQVQPVNIQAVVDINNDVADNSVKWSIDDPELIRLAANDDEDGENYTKKSASIGVNLDAGFFTDTIRKLEAAQAAAAYRYPIPDTIYGAGHQSGGVAVLTASTRPAASFDGKPCTDNCRINVTFQIKDKTYVANEGASLNKEELSFTVTRKLAGNRKSPVESIQVTPPQTLTAAFSPDFFDKKDIVWSVDDSALISVDGEDKAASVAAKKDAKWITDVIAADAGLHENDPYAVLDGFGTRTAKVTVTADDMLGNRQTADCTVAIRFVTEDQTRVYVEGAEIEPAALSYDLTCTETGRRTSPVITWTGNEAKQVQVTVLPEQAFNKNYTFAVSDDSLTVEKNGTVTANTDAKWIQELNRTYPHTGNHTAVITAVTEDGGFKASCSVTLTYKLTDNTYYGGSSSGGGGGSSGGGGGGGSSSGVSPSGGVGPAAGPAAGTTAPAGSITGTWVNTADGTWAFTSNGRTYHDEWAYIHNPYAAKNQSSTDWFRFDATGHMITGWFTDADGNSFYLSPLSDGTQGHMAEGWQWIAGADGKERCYYFNPVPDGTRGMLLKNAVAPDGNQTNEKGEWTVNEIVQERAVQDGKEK